jgi:peptidoglycan L-alanyl-D-glutamate endopeptidase CwlK
MIAASKGIQLLPHSFHRTTEEQEKLFADGKSQLDGVAKRSKHQDWLAIDSVIVNKDGSLCWDGEDQRYQELRDIAKIVGLETGFDWSFKDSTHTQLPG